MCGVPMDDFVDALGRDAQGLVEEIRPLLAGYPSPTVGAALADLLAIWLAGHFAGGAAENAALREELLAMHLKVVRKLIPVNERELLRRQ